jgi:hypothetical protein
VERKEQLNQADFEHAAPAVILPVRYDKTGKMLYHPQLHGKRWRPWTTSEQAFLIENYEHLGPEQVSLALERTMQTVMTRVYELRRAGQMPKPQRKIVHPRSSRGLNKLLPEVASVSAAALSWRASLVA